MYRIEEISLADTQRLIEYKLDQAYGAEFDIKGFDYPWIATSRSWSSSDRILDVGAAYSPLPIHLADSNGSEVWAVDDFGQGSDEAFWTRSKDPQEHIQANPQVKYVVERLGDPANSSLPENYFDCIYSASTLEHVPAQQTEAVWRHMDRLLKPGGTMLHAVDIGLPTYRGVWSFGKALAIELIYPILPKSFKIKYLYHTPSNYARFIMATLGARHTRLNQIGVVKMVIDPEVMLEPPQWTYNRIVKDGIRSHRHVRVTSLLIKLNKI
jgi:2-polyprenyl-3-methyl-5-hydroxy-6-metoxy-1,4-benzoquinol methylase